MILEQLYVYKIIVYHCLFNERNLTNKTLRQVYKIRLEPGIEKKQWFQTYARFLKRVFV